ncbi:MAG: nicotinate-nicotinamide nucleotide adenylyltransferase [bacterium]
MNSEIKNIAIFGGKFDPPHLAHKMTIDLAFNKYSMDEAWLIPSFKHPFRFELSSFEHRLKMCLIMADCWESGKVKTLDTEREINSGFTVDVLTHLASMYPQNNFHLFIGVDNWNKREKWREFNKIESICKSIVVIGRANEHFNGFALPDISSSAIKEKIKKGEAVSEYLLKEIENYIKLNSLYI